MRSPFPIEVILLFGLLTPTGGLAEDTTESEVWCPDRPDVELASCREHPEEIDFPTFLVRTRMGCIGAPGAPRRDAPQCVPVHVVDAADRQPLDDTCAVALSGRGRILRASATIEGGDLLIPRWCESAHVRCPGHADFSVSQADADTIVTVRAGRAVQLTAIPTISEPAAGATSVTLALDGGPFTIEKEIHLATPSTLGNIPIGRYELTIHSPGAAPVADSFMLEPDPSPLDLVYHLVDGVCLQVVVQCADCTTDGLACL